jgi:glycosyltransferase involved in cell wall biosynthesis/O-antigen/teichoic acid export membrane protein
MHDSRTSLHILVLTDRDWTHPQAGGTGTNLYGQVSRWLAWGHRVSVVACSYPGAKAVEPLDGLTIHRVGGRSTVFPRAIWKQWRGLVPDADVVLEVVNGITFLTPLWLRKPRVTLIHHIHREHYEREMGRKGRLAAFILEAAPLRWLYPRSRFMTISRASAHDIAGHGIAPERIEVNYNGVELAAFEPRERTPEPTLLYLGRLKRYKRIEVVIDVLEALPDAVLDIAGDGDHREALEAEIERRGLDARVRIHGHVSEERKRELLGRSWVNLSASSAEGWNLAVMEAAACETPSAALAVGGLPESIEHGRTGLLAETPEELTAHTRRLLDDAELRGRLGRQARERAAGFTWDATAERTLALLESERERALGREAEGTVKSFARSDTGRAAALAAAVMGANVIALVFTVVFARILGASGYGSLAALLAAFLILSVPGQALQVTVAREVSAAAAVGDPAPAAGVWRWLKQLTALLAVVAAVSLLLREPIADLIGVGDLPWAAGAALPTGWLWLILSIERGALQGLQRYGMVGLSITGEAAARLVCGLILVAAGLDVAGAYLGTTLSILAAAAVLAVPLHRATVGPHLTRDRPFSEILSRSWAPVLALALIAVLQNVDVIAVKREATGDEAGSYAAAAVAAKAIIWIAIGLGLYLLPEAARRARTGVDARPILIRTLALIALTAGPMVLLYAVAAEPLLRAVFGDDLTLAADALPWLGVAMTLLACTYLSVQYLLALHRARFIWALGVAAVLEPVLVAGAAPDLTTVAFVLLALQAILATTVLALGFRSRPAPVPAQAESWSVA